MAAAALYPGEAAADQASQPGAPEAGHIGTGFYHSCAVVSGAVRCWGYGGDGALGYGNTASIGDDEAPQTAGPVFLGAGRTAVAVAVGSVHTCALLDNGTVRCWGFGANGRLGNGNENTIGDNETPGSLPPVSLGAGRKAKAIAAGDGHTCAILDDDTVRCWGFNVDGRLGYGHIDSIGDDEPPGDSGPVNLGRPLNLGPPHTAKAITAGGSHTCALLDDGAVRCWGFGGSGRLGYGKQSDVGRFRDTTPDTVGPVNLGAGRTATAISAGLGHTCAILDNGTVRCWGFNLDGRLGYGNTNPVGDNEQPAMVAPVNFGQRAKAIHAGSEHTCALLDDGSVRCWGVEGFGQLGYDSTTSIGDDEPASSAGPVALARAATAVSAGQHQSCALLDDGSVRCWGRGSLGRLGYCNEVSIGDNETPATAGPVPLGQLGIPRPASCPVGSIAPPPPPPLGDVVAVPPPASSASPVPPGADPLTAALAAERARAARMRACMRPVTARRGADRRRARALVGARRRLALRLAISRYAKARIACVTRHGRVPGRATRLTAVPTGGGNVRLTFHVAGSNGFRAPAARTYLIKQSTRPIRTARDFARAAPLCRGRCSFPELTSIHATATLTVTKLVRNRLYYYAVAARDNVSSRVGPRSRTVSVRPR